MFPEPYNGFFAEGREKNWKEIIERKNKSRAETVGEVGRGPCRGQTLVRLVLEDQGVVSFHLLHAPAYLKRRTNGSCGLCCENKLIKQDSRMLTICYRERLGGKMYVQKLLVS